MSSRSVKNLRPSRGYAALVALLYVFLCTFGTLTHTHGGPEIPASASQATLHSVGQAPTHLVASSPVHCAFCDWEANSVSVALLPISLGVPPQGGALASPGRLLSAAWFSTRASSRGPPSV